jgi:hypothetical protein
MSILGYVKTSSTKNLINDNQLVDTTSTLLQYAKAQFEDRIVIETRNFDFAQGFGPIQRFYDFDADRLRRIFTPLLRSENRTGWYHYWLIPVFCGGGTGRFPPP